MNGVCVVNTDRECVEIKIGFERNTTLFQTGREKREVAKRVREDFDAEGGEERKPSKAEERNRQKKLRRERKDADTADTSDGEASGP